MLSERTIALIDNALQEDIGSGDITTTALIPSTRTARARIIAREELMVCGHEIARFIFSRLHSTISYMEASLDGTKLGAGEVLATLEGSLRALLSAERVALNFLQRLSGIATATDHMVNKLRGVHSNIQILDTRKTTPGWRELERYAVRVGGGVNHRFGLFDAVLIKNNHIDAFPGGIVEAIRCCQQNVARGIKIEVEVRNFEELQEALLAKPDRILLDNMTPVMLREAINLVLNSPGGKEIQLEASGRITEENLLQYAIPGLDFISMGMLTHSVKASDISLRIET